MGYYPCNSPHWMAPSCISRLATGNASKLGVTRRSSASHLEEKRLNDAGDPAEWDRVSKTELKPLENRINSLDQRCVVTIIPCEPSLGTLT